MKELLSISKYNQDSTQNDAICIDSSDTSVSCKHDSDIALFCSMLTTIQADVFSLKQENKSLREDYREELKSIKDDVIVTIDKLQETANDCKQVVDRVTDDRLNGITRVKNDLKLVQFDMKTLNENLDARCNELVNKFSLVPKLDKRFSKLEQKCAISKETPSDYVTSLKSTCEASIQTPVGNDSPPFVAKKITLTRENNDNECTGKLVQCPITNKFYRQLADNKPTKSGKSDPDFHAHSNIQSNHTMLKQQPTLCVSEATDTYVDSACSYFQDSSLDSSNVGHSNVISVPVRNRFDALHDNRVNSHISYSEALKNGQGLLSMNHVMRLPLVFLFIYQIGVSEMEIRLARPLL